MYLGETGPCCPECGMAPHPDNPHPAKAIRNPATTHLLSLFEHGHLPEHLAIVSRSMEAQARNMAEYLPDGPELTAGLRKLLEAKDCFVRQAVIDAKARGMM